MDIHVCYAHFTGVITEVETLGNLKGLIRIIHVMCHISCCGVDSPEMVASAFLSTLLFY